MRKRKRTAVLCVHGIGNQRTQETVRGIVKAVWLDDDALPGPSGREYRKKVWTHPESTVEDLDLVVMTTNEARETSDQRSIDFHEIYWAHLMSETRSVAVLLWLFELVRKGPRLKKDMRAIWWVGAVFLSVLMLSISVLGLIAVHKLASLAGHENVLILAPLFALLVTAVVGVVAAFIQTAFRIGVAIAAITLCAAAICFALAWPIQWLAGGWSEQMLNLPAVMFGPFVVALALSFATMSWWGVLTTVITYAVSMLAALGYWHWRGIVHWGSDHPFATAIHERWFPWSFTEQWSIVIACAVVLLYLALNAAFLQSFLGDAARYFRNSPANVLVRRAIRKLAVDTLASLHGSGDYDRIIVVAHSLGSVVAYDMLRAYFGRIAGDLPPASQLQPEFDKIDNLAIAPSEPATAGQKKELRVLSRALVERLSHVAARQKAGSKPGQDRTAGWLVTDFVTLGSPLTHSVYLICNGRTVTELETDFKRRVREREFPTCPPLNVDEDRILSFYHPGNKRKQFHHAAVFGLTRWSNLYFPLSQLLWGDAIGGKLAPLFGSHIEDIEVPSPVSLLKGLFTHTKYWTVDNSKGGRKAEHIVLLRKAIDLADRDKAKV